MSDSPAKSSLDTKKPSAGKSWAGRKLRDPIWQFWGVAATLIVFLLPIIYAYVLSPAIATDHKSKIQIGTSYTQRLTSFPDDLVNRVKVVIDGTEEKQVRRTTYYFQFKGQSPIQQGDFVKPIRGTLPEDRKIVGVQPSKEPVYGINVPRIDGDRLETVGYIVLYEVDQKKTRPAKPAEIEVVILDQRNFEVKCPLMNPDEWFAIDVYSASAETSKDSSLAINPNGKTAGNSFNNISRNTNSAKRTPRPGNINTNSARPTTTISDQNRASKSSSNINPSLGEAEWSCRVAGVECPGSFDYDEYQELLKENTLWVYEIRHVGWSIYFIVVFNSFSLLLFLIIGSSTGFLSLKGPKGLAMFFVFSLLSLGASEIIADIIFGRGYAEQPKMSYAIMLFFLLIWSSLGFFFLKSRKLNMNYEK